MSKDLKTRLSSVFPNISFDDSHWSKALTGADDVSVFYIKSMTDYYSQYHEGDNISFVVVEQNMPICALPLFAYLENGKWGLSSNGSTIIPPLFLKDTPKKTKKRISKLLHEIICFLSKELEISSINISEHSSTISDWYLLWLRESTRDSLCYHFAINLLQNIEQIKLGFRKSYKPLVSKGFREWDIQISENNCDDDFEEFRLLHLEVSGRETRSIETWKIQKEQIRKKEAFLVTVRDQKKLIGAGFFNYSRDMGIYSVGAYKRDMFDKPIGHAVQMAAIQKLKNLGCKIYYLGLMANKFNREEISKKELSISYFKEGFASYVIAQPNLVVSFND